MLFSVCNVIVISTRKFDKERTLLSVFVKISARLSDNFSEKHDVYNARGQVTLELN